MHAREAERSSRALNRSRFLRALLVSKCTGKTSTVLAMARELYGPELMKKRVLELNASNERGIDVIRHKVKEFAQIAVGSRDSVAGYPCPPFKIIILDEADSMTKDAQSALRRTMEQYTKVTRFAIICNYVSRSVERESDEEEGWRNTRWLPQCSFLSFSCACVFPPPSIIEPITSRCAKFRYAPLSSESMVGRLRTIAGSEHVTLNEETLEKLVELSEGDMRRSITILQSAQKLRGMGTTLSPGDVMEVAGVIPPERITELLASAKGSTFRHLQQSCREMIYSAYPVDAILAQLLPAIMRDSTIGDVAKAKICVRIAENEHRLIEGADEYLQLLDVMSFAAQTMAAAP